MTPRISSNLLLLFSRARGLWAGLPLFWKIQISAWVILAVVSFPLKVSYFGSVSLALLVTILREPFGLLATCGFRLLYRRIDLHLNQPIRLLLWVVPICFAAGAVDFLYSETILHYGWGITSEQPAGLFYLRSLLYFSWTFLYFWIRDYLAVQARLAELAKAEAAAREAELLMLRAQVSPHFLFNSLNAILANLTRQPAAVETIVLGLSDYFRYSLRNRNSASVTIGEEFDAMSSYLSVEKARFRDSVEIETAIDPDVRSVQVPGVFLQPLLENALHYSMKTSPLPRKISVKVGRSVQGELTLEVTHSGKWVDPPAKDQPDGEAGNGLTTLKRRLVLLYPNCHTFTAGPNAAGDQVTVRINLSLPDIVEVLA